jgi:hypothetical protein
VSDAVAGWVLVSERADLKIWAAAGIPKSRGAASNAAAVTTRPAGFALKYFTARFKLTTSRPAVAEDSLAAI